MDDKSIYRRLRGALGNAVVWGGLWFAAVLVLGGALRVTGVLTSSWEAVLMTAFRGGIIGGIAGAAFSTVIGLLYRGRRLSEINWIRFGLGGAIATGLFVPVFLQFMNLLSGDGMVPMGLVLDDIPLAAVLGGVAAGGSLKLAQHAEKALSGRTEHPVGRLASAALQSDPVHDVGEARVAVEAGVGRVDVQVDEPG